MAGDFGTTQWSLVLAVRTDDPDRARAALSELCGIYWYPLYAFVRRQVRDASEAADLTQSFFVHLLEKDVLRRADPALGRFRSYLLASVKNFLSNERDREAARKRGGGVEAISLDVLEADRRYQAQAVARGTPEDDFDRQWAHVVLQQALEHVHAEYRKGDREREFEELSPYLTADAPDTPYQHVAERLAMSEAAVKTAVHRMRKRYGRALREEIAQTTCEPSEVDAEIRHLLAVLAPA